MHLNKSFNLRRNLNEKCDISNFSAHTISAFTTRAGIWKSSIIVWPNFAVLFECAILFEQVDGCWDFFVNPKTNIPKKWYGFMRGSPPLRPPPPPPEDFLSSHVDLPLLSWKILISPNNLGINSKWHNPVACPYFLLQFLHCYLLATRRSTKELKLSELSFYSLSLNEHLAIYDSRISVKINY